MKNSDYKMDTHEVDPIWREVRILLYDTYQTAAKNFVEHCDDLLGMFECLGDEKAQHELRAIRSLINIRITEFNDESERLRNETLGN